MEIHLPGTNIESVIDAQVNSAREKLSNIRNDRKVAEETSALALTKQFQNELNTYLDSSILSSLQIQVLPPKELSFLSVTATFSYLNISIYIKRTIDDWEIAYGGNFANVSGEMLQTQLIYELSKIRENNKKS